MKKELINCLFVIVLLVLLILPTVSFADTNSSNITESKFKQYWDGELNYLDDDLLIGLSYGHSASGIYSYDIRISESNNTATFTVTCYNPKSYTKERISEHYNKFINSIMKTIGYQNTKTDWSPYIAYGMSSSKMHVYINGYDFYFYTKTTHEYPHYAGRNGVDMIEFSLGVSKVKNAEFIYETIADSYCISGVSSCGDTLTLPSEAQGKAVEGIILNKPYSIYDENIKTIVIGSQMHTVPASTLNLVFPNLEEFVVGNNNPYIAQIDGCLYNKKVKTLIACPAKKTELVIPEGIVGIEHFACLYARNLSKVEIPSTCTIIGTSAFEECTSLKEIKFAEASCWVVEEKAFNGCTSLSKIDLSATLCVEIEANAFSGCTKLADVQLPNVLKKIGNNAFENCPIKEIALSDELEFIGGAAFGPALQRVVLPSNVNQLYPTSFTPYCLASVAENNEHYYESDGVIFSKEKELVFYPYNAKKDTSYEIPQGTTAILCNMGSQLKELTIPASVTKILVGLSVSKLNVISGSYAESYAIEKQYNYESKIVESDNLDWLLAPIETETSLPENQEKLQTKEISSSQEADDNTIYEDEWVTIKFDHFDYQSKNDWLQVYCILENHSDYDFYVTMSNAVCNGWGIGNDLISVPAKSKLREKYIFYSFSESAGFSDVKSIESFRFDIKLTQKNTGKIFKRDVGPYYIDSSLYITD